ncbi:relaxase/mobilization nuclease domain-containing protein [Tardiphaga sp. 215_C5_N2_1]|uniref:relaxase/mobilization nuclease domain-containing protein n=1 Tax=Tardiphaga sp. 215_C5_N2_1 TaxID=3240774 RepID=UPI003F888EF8
MILKASQRGGPRQLAAHLLNLADNDHVTVQELRGFIADDLHGAMTETLAISKGTRCQQPVFSLSLNPPKDAEASIDDLIAAADRAEAAVGLEGQPRAIVIHEKNGRRHAHAVWSRIDAAEMKAVNLPFFKTRLNDLAKELYLEHGWELPDGLKENGWQNPLNFTLAEFQQAKRLGLDPREIKQVFQSAWRQSDGLPAFKNALESHGYFLAQGDRRGFVALDVHGEVYSVARFVGVKTKELGQRLGSPSTLASVDATRQRIQALGGDRARQTIAAQRDANRAKVTPYREQLRMLVKHHRKERSILDDRQAVRRIAETKARADKFRRGLGAVMDVLTGRLFATKKENEREAYDCALRDRAQREGLVFAQMKEREALHRHIAEMERTHRQENRELVRRFIVFARVAREKHHDLGLSL